MLLTIGVDIRENADLIIYYLSFLKIFQEDFINNYQPTHWEQLSSYKQQEIIKPNLLD
ncbi:hypothetical protein VP01_7327g1 [Puccinia sorghi]|uniref:Uncharacterized protein n=1 Tax=Puccinia sorghi TaxID=27349 RepID=A0A0L6UCV8_9BASI|nr:hypothetical protein VP01_7327g1 [Puccinia sorghi]